MNVQCFSPSTQQGPESFLLRGCGLLAVCGMSNHLTTGLETRSLNRPFLFLLVWCHHVKTGCCLQTQAAAEPSNSHKIRSPQGCCSSRAGRGRIRSNTGLQTLESPLPILAGLRACRVTANAQHNAQHTARAQRILVGRPNPRRLAGAVNFQRDVL